MLESIVDALLAVARSGLPLVFPLHPRTRARLDQIGLVERLNGSTGRDSPIRLLDPMSYIGFMSVVVDCRVAIADSGGIQEETSYLGIPCLTLSDDTEKPITLSLGTNRLVKAAGLRAALETSLTSDRKRPTIDLCDGRRRVRLRRASKGLSARLRA